MAVILFLYFVGILFLRPRFDDFFDKRILVSQNRINLRHRLRHLTPADLPGALDLPHHFKVVTLDGRTLFRVGGSRSRVVRIALFAGRMSNARSQSGSLILIRGQPGS